MAFRTWSILAVLMIAGAALSGCTSPSDDARAAEPPAANPPADDGTSEGGGDATGDGQDAPARSIKPATEPVTAEGSIRGQFEKEWLLEVPTAGFKQTLVEFNLSGVQDGAPPTARVYFALYKPDGSLLKGATLGMGQDPLVTWTLTNADMPEPGAYLLKATAEPQNQSPTGVPSFGLADYELYAYVEY